MNKNELKHKIKKFVQSINIDLTITMCLMTIMTAGFTYYISKESKDTKTITVLTEEPQSVEIVDAADAELINKTVEDINNADASAYIQTYNDNHLERTGTLKNLEFIVLVRSESNGIVYGDAITKDNFYGPITVKRLDDSSFESNKLYVITTEPLIRESGDYNVVEVTHRNADENDLSLVESIKENRTNYYECVNNYKYMEVEDIVQDANKNYILWTDKNIDEFTKLIKKMKLTEEQINKLDFMKLSQENLIE